MQPATVATQQNATANVPITAALRNFYQNIAGTPSSQQAEGDVASFNKMVPRSADILSAFDEQYGVNAQNQRVGDLRKSVMQAEDLVNNVDENVFARTSNALVSDAQRAKLTASERDPLVKQLGVISRNFDVANQDLAGMRETSNRYSSAELGDINTMRGTLGERLGTSQQREAVEREKMRQEEENRRWWENFYLEKSKTDAYISNLNQQSQELKSRIAASNASTQALLKGLNSAGQSTVAPPKSTSPITTLTDKSGKVLGYEGLNTPSTLTAYGQQQEDKSWKNYQRYGKTDPNAIDVIGKFGPLALFGGGWAW